MTDNLSLFNSLCHQMKYDRWEGWRSTYSDQIRLFNTTEYQKYHPVMYEPGLVVMFSGRKTGYINTYRLDYGTDGYLLITTPYPLECESFASEEEPMCGLYFSLQPEIIFKLIEVLKSHGTPLTGDTQRTSVGFDVTPKTERIEQCVSRILTILHDPIETDALLDGVLEELYYLLLKSEEGQILVNFATKDGTYYKVAKAVSHINDHYDEKLSVEQLARVAGMSTSAFHRAFKACITDSPLKYLKKIRLNRAKSYMLKDGATISEAAFRVGYESVPQFSREFKRYFGLPPSKVEELGYRVFL